MRNAVIDHRAVRVLGLAPPALNWKISSTRFGPRMRGFGGRTLDLRDPGVDAGDFRVRLPGGTVDQFKAQQSAVEFQGLIK